MLDKTDTENNNLFIYFFFLQLMYDHLNDKMCLNKRLTFLQYRKKGLSFCFIGRCNI